MRWLVQPDDGVGISIQRARSSVERPYNGSVARVTPEEFPDPIVDSTLAPERGPARAVLAGGCFWCVEAVYKNLDGVSTVKSGYAGGSAETADYETVSSGTTNHAESVEVDYDPSRLTYGQILKVFFAIAHDPTQLNRQGPDTGRQYRSAIFFGDEEQKRVALAYIEQLNKAHVFDRPIVTEVVPLEAFYPAETYHQDYAARNPLNPYIVFNAQPKVRKMRAYQASKEKVSS
jgi:peptide-methionine (S)-S-oxide reductase